MIRRPPRSTRKESSAASDVYKRQALNILVKLAPPVKDFFEQVVVNSEDERVRNSRFLLLQYGRVYMNQVADLSLMVS